MPSNDPITIDLLVGESSESYADSLSHLSDVSVYRGVDGNQLQLVFVDKDNAERPLNIDLDQAAAFLNMLPETKYHTKYTH